MFFYRGDYFVIPVNTKKGESSYKLASNENIIFSLKRSSEEKDYVLQKSLNNGITWDNESERYLIEISHEDTKDLELCAENVRFQYDVVVILQGNKPITKRGSLTIKRDITRNEFITESTGLTQEQVEAINSTVINLDEELSIEYDENVLDLDFMIDGIELVIDNNIEGLDFNINKNGELEAIY